MKYTIKNDIHYDEGGSAEFYLIKENESLGFKQFGSKRSATTAYNKQKLLSKYNLAPKIIGKITKLKYEWGDDTDWGYVTERAKVLDEKVMNKRLKDIQNLVETIENKTRLRFWDCHYYNIGYVKRNNKAKLVCIDTGPESFNRDANAWGMATPGPKCGYCNRYCCNC
jgi:exopolyphosphatase/pppGpp-phosphohydrolase